MLQTVPLSILDRANNRVRGADGTEIVPEGRILRGVVDRARRAESLGYRRFWVAEHHAVPGIAGSAPTVLMAALAARTSTIRVGSGGIMVPDHQPLVVAEQLATLEALFPGRIDAGLGASVGFTAPVRRALRQDAGARERFADDARELLAYLDGVKRDGAQVTARPANAGHTPAFILTGGGALPLAARLGVGAVVALAPSRPGRVVQTAEAVAAYRRAFTRRGAGVGERGGPGSNGTVILAVNAAVADTVEAARALLIPEATALVDSRRTGEFGPLRAAPLTGTADRDAARVDRRLADSVFGPPHRVAAELADLLERTGADEILVTGGMADPDAQLRSDELLACAWDARGGA